MNTVAKRFQAAVSCVVAIIVLPWVAFRTAGAQSVTQLVDETARHRIVVVLDSRLANSAAATGAAQQVMAGGHLDHSAMLHRFRAELIDSAGQPVVAGNWGVTISADTSASAEPGAVRPIIMMTAQANDLIMPRPFGFQLHSADSVLVSATVDSTSAARGLRVRVTVDYDPVPQSRVAVRTVAAESADSAREQSADSANAVRTVEWRPEMAGEMVAITGLSLQGVNGLTLQDATTGEVLWRSHPADGAQGATPARQTVRPSAIVEAGHLYRLSITYIRMFLRAPTGMRCAPTAIVLPSRIGQ